MGVSNAIADMRTTEDGVVCVELALFLPPATPSLMKYEAEFLDHVVTARERRIPSRFEEFCGYRGCHEDDNIEDRLRIRMLSR